MENATALNLDSQPIKNDSVTRGQKSESHSS